MSLSAQAEISLKLTELFLMQNKGVVLNTSSVFNIFMGYIEGFRRYNEDKVSNLDILEEDE